MKSLENVSADIGMIKIWLSEIEGDASKVSEIELTLNESKSLMTKVLEKVNEIYLKMTEKNLVPNPMLPPTPSPEIKRAEPSPGGSNWNPSRVRERSPLVSSNSQETPFAFSQGRQGSRFHRGRGRGVSEGRPEVFCPR